MSTNVDTPSPPFSGQRAEVREYSLEGRAHSPASLHWSFLVASIVVVALAATMSIHEGVSVSLPGINIPLPELCYFRRGTGFGCPGCGLTRSFIALAHGEFARAWLFNPAGVLLFPLVAIQIPYQAAQLLRLRTGRQPWNLAYVGVAVFAAAAFVMLAQWIVKLSGW